MPARQVIVDGSNLATEGRSLPSLAQLDQAVREFLAENPDVEVTVVVDASFGHRIDPSEVPTFEEAEAAGELVSPPAGAIGRGDAFLLRIAEKTGATVLSNDSFQEFHGEHAWLFDDGRLIGGKPVPGVGWIFMPRTPVRGQKSREVVKEAKRKKRAEDATVGAGSAGAAGSAGPVSGGGLDLAASRSKGRPKKVDRAIARATEEAVEPKSAGRRRRRTSGVPPAEPVNEPLVFITFIAAHPLGSEVVGTVAEFSSHGAFVEVDGARCYLPLSAMGDPPPRRAREVVSRGEERSFVIQALDPQRRGVELALPGFARVAGGPTEETVEAEIHPKVAASKHRRGPKAAPPVPVAAGDSAGVPAGVAGGGPAGVSDGKLTAVPALTPVDQAEVESGAAGANASARAKKTAAGPKKAAAGAEKTAATKAAGGAKKTAAGAEKTAATKAAGGAKKTAKAVEAAAPRRASAPKKAATPAKGRAPSKAAEATKAGTVLKQVAPAQKRAAPAKDAVKTKKAGPAAQAASADQTRSRPSKQKAPAKVAGPVKKVPAARAEQT